MVVAVRSVEVRMGMRVVMVRVAGVRMRTVLVLVPGMALRRWARRRRIGARRGRAVAVALAGPALAAGGTERPEHEEGHEEDRREDHPARERVPEGRADHDARFISSWGAPPPSCA
ncbi:MAG: hypothetical protein ACTHU0_03795 [Kofleriaceae bacterium]